MASETLQISFKDKIINLHFEEFEDDIDIDQLTTIDWTNLYAEIVTIPALMNRVGIWKPEAENAHSSQKMGFEIYKAQTAHRLRRTFKTVISSAGKDSKKPKSNPEIEEEVLMDEGVQLRHKKLLRLKKEAEYMDALYWAVKSKEMKLNRISDNMGFAPEDFEKSLVEGKYNGILIKAREKLIK